MNISSIKIATIFIYIFFFLIIILGFSGYIELLTPFAALGLVECYIMWLGIACITLTSGNVADRRKYKKVTAVGMVSYFIVWIGLVPGLAEKVTLTGPKLDDLTILFVPFFYFAFIYLSVIIAKKLVKLDNELVGDSESSFGYSMLLILFPILSFPFLYRRFTLTASLLQAKPEYLQSTER